MFDDQQPGQQGNINNDGTGGISAPTLGGLGINPSNPVAPPVTLPSQHLATTLPSAPHTLGTSTQTSTSGLEDIKRRALEQLSPLVGKLDQTPEEKYKTLMMMIQASDNHDLINEAYENAQKISDEKAKAEALLNIVNEINYFTQKNQD